MWVSSSLAVAGGALVWLAVEDGPYVSASAPFDPHAIRHVASNHGVRLATLGYQWVFLLPVPGPVLGALAKRRLAATPH
jgi:hypothetical protein